ncbi:unnamed protein product [Timema podura]|uniref:Peptidase S8 pro-domain domain-containing protein n=1 Tax=Timema podura TaxID=61482 RepID=A0ABN7NTE2_TIMPD|nr:unnamed protein product [Timema podura]
MKHTTKHLFSLAASHSQHGTDGLTAGPRRRVTQAGGRETRRIGAWSGGRLYVSFKERPWLGQRGRRSRSRRLAGSRLIDISIGSVLFGVLGFPDTYRMLKNDHPPVHKRAHSYLSERLTLDARVLWAEQQFIKQRTKRGIVPPIDRSTQRGKRWDLSVPSRTNRYLFNDELWDEEWYLQDTRTRPDLPKLDLHVLPVYEQGITGRGVRVCVLDDGVEFRHEDLQHNYVEGKDENVRIDYLNELNEVLNACGPGESFILLRDVNGWVCNQKDNSKRVSVIYGDDRESENGL